MKGLNAYISLRGDEGVKRMHLHLFTFTFMHLADAFIQSDLQLHSGYTFSLVHVFPGNACISLRGAEGVKRIH